MNVHPATSTVRCSGGPVLGPSRLPPVAYFASVPVSFPLIGLTQFTVVALPVARFSCRLARLWASLRPFLYFLPKVMCPSSTTHSRQLFGGLRGQQLFPVLALESSVVCDSIGGGEGQSMPTPSVYSLFLKDLHHTSRRQTSTFLQIRISLYNVPRSFIVTSPPRALYGLVADLRKISVPTMARSRSPSERRSSVRASFLWAYHSTVSISGMLPTR
jgi:fatty acid synthase subunit alpha, fungi type